MNTEHLKDTDIQRIAFHASECEPEIIKHFHSCNECKKRVESYQLISKTILDQPEASFGFDLSEMVLAQLPSTPQKYRALNFLINGLIIVCLIIFGLAIYNLKDVLVELFSNTSAIINYFIICVAVLIAMFVGLDTYRSFDKKIRTLKFS